MQTITTEKDRRQAARLFADFTFGYAADAILEGHMGRVLVDVVEDPQFTALEVRNDLFGVLVLGGEPGLSAAREFVGAIPENTEVLFASEPMLDLAKDTLGGRAIERERHLLSSKAIDIESVQRLAHDVQDGFDLVPIDVELAQTLRTDERWFDTGHGINFASAEDFVDRGFGFCLLANSTIVAAASTFMIASRGIEIQINTAESHRRRGLATIVAAVLIEESLSRGLDPCWDASSQASADLARKLGYVPDRSARTLIVVD